MAEAKQYTATLVSGLNYTQIVPNEKDPYKPTELVFKKGEPKVISAEVKALLEINAMENVGVTIAGRTTAEQRSKFEFKPVRERAAAPAEPAS